MQENLRNITIIGGSFGGLITAIALKNKGFNVNVYEGSEENADPLITVNILPNAVKILKKLGLFDEIKKKACRINELLISNEKGKVLQRVNINDIDNSAAYSLHPEDFRRILYDALPGEIIHKEKDKDFVSCKNENNNVKIEFSDGSIIYSQLLIGADGINSRIREQIKNDGKPVYRGYRFWHGIVNFSHKDLPANESIEFLGKGKRFGIMPLGNGRISWWATANEKQSLPHHMSGRKKKLRSKFRNWYAPIPLLISATPDENILKTNALDRVPSPGWHDGRVVLIGNAAHPTTPNGGLEINLSIEDAWVLTELLEKENNIETALTKYEETRFARTAEVRKAALKHGEIGQWEKPVAAYFRNIFINVLPTGMQKKFITDFISFDATI